MVLVGQTKAIAIAVRNVSGRRRWSKLREWLGRRLHPGMPFRGCSAEGLLILPGFGKPKTEQTALRGRRRSVLPSAGLMRIYPGASTAGIVAWTHTRNKPHLLKTLAQEWTRTSLGSPPIEDGFSRLLQAIWRGDLIGRLNPAAAGADPCISMLNVLRIHPDQPGLLVLDSQPATLPTIINSYDGSELPDFRPVLVWPQDPSLQTADLFEAACAVLAKAEWDDYHDEVKLVFHRVHIERDDFAAFCKKYRYPLPGFWFGDGNPEAECQRWLLDLIQRHPDRKPGTKADLFKTARKNFPGLTERAFERIWSRYAPASWKTPGAPHKP